MNADSGRKPRFLGLSAAQAAGLVIAVATAFRLFFCTWLPMVPDETYYFQWSRHLDASYYSKGPAVAYTIACSTWLLGATPLGVRFFAVLLSAGTAWQVFLLARRWFDETAALISVLLLGVIPLYSVGAVLMTIDPLSAFFWIWAANLFSAALSGDRTRDWLLTGFAVGCGFLAKYLNALELVAFLAFLLLAPARRTLLARPGFWLMLATAAFCAVPVFWWNQQHHWASATQLGDRGRLHEGFHLNLPTFFNFLELQAVVISPLLFIILLMTALATARALLSQKSSARNEGELLLLLLFLTVFLFYAMLSLHLRGEPNWPAVSYLTLIILLAARHRELLASRPFRRFLATAFCLGWLQTVLLHDTRILHLPGHLDPLKRTAGWVDIAARVDVLRQQQGADILLADGYKEASALSFELPGKPFFYALRSDPPANQFDLWPGISWSTPHRILWVTDDQPPTVLADHFSSVTPLERLTITMHGVPLRSYRIYLCQSPAR